MCTVTFIPSGDKIYLTSNRDEKHWRLDAVAPASYELPSGKVLFPKDGNAGGTWIAAHENGNAIVFLNGGLVCHTPQPPYKKSRGLILLDLIEGQTSYNSFLAINLNNIEPFTAIIWDDNHLFECRWDGHQKHHKQLDASKPHIWSSVTLYNEEVIRKRKKWFETWLKRNKQPMQKDILHFHQFTGDGDQHNDLMMNREGRVFTVSVTSMAITEHGVSMQYLDLKNNQTHLQELAFEKSMVSR
jgi:hypothetical protein